MSPEVGFERQFGYVEFRIEKGNSAVLCIPVARYTNLRWTNDVSNLSNIDRDGLSFGKWVAVISHGGGVCGQLETESG